MGCEAMRVTVVTGPPCAGKSTWIAERAKPGDIVIDLDRIALALTTEGTVHHHYPEHVRDVARAARLAAIDVAMHSHADTWIIDTAMTRRERASWHRKRADVVTLDPGREEVARRIAAERPEWVQAVADEWYRVRDHESRAKKSGSMF